MFFNKKSLKSAFHKKYRLKNKVLDQGAYYSVRLATSVKMKKNVVVRILDKTKLTNREAQNVNKTYSILKTLDHKNVEKVYDYFEESSSVYIVTEYVEGGELFHKIVDDEMHFTEDKCKQIIKTVAEALLYCKQKGIIHGDIKPGNILLTDNDHDDDEVEIKLTGFMLAKEVDPSNDDFKTLDAMCGTLSYVAPEVVSGQTYGHKCDIWGLGVITFLLLSGGYLPFFINPHKEGRAELLSKIELGQWKFAPRDAWKNISSAAKDFLSKVLERDPNLRLSYEQILDHPWMNSEEGSDNNIDLSEMMQLNEKRKLLSAVKVKDTVDTLKNLMGDIGDDIKFGAHIEGRSPGNEITNFGAGNEV